VAATFRLQIVNPERMIVDADVESVVIPATGGFLGILRNHVPIIGSLEIGVVKYRGEGQQRFVACNQGVFEMRNNTLKVIADTAEPGEEIDLTRAREALHRAEQRLDQRPKDLNILRAELALKRATARINAARGAGNK
jgi:F-type H+-transporting ATPase subunit epsilon